MDSVSSKTLVRAFKKSSPSAVTSLSEMIILSFCDIIYPMGTQVKLTREEAIKENIKSFQKLSPSAKIRYVEKAKKRLKYFRSLQCAPAPKH